MKRNEKLKIFHGKKTNIIVKLFINILFVIWFILLLIFCYKDWGYLLFLNKILLSRRRKIIIAVLFLALLIVSLVWLYKNLFIKYSDWNEFWHNLWPLFLVLYIFIWIFFNNFVDLVFKSSFKIDENMSFLPKSIEWRKTIVQYNLSKEITPSEAWFLLYREADIANLLCIIYRWYNEKIIDI